MAPRRRTTVYIGEQRWRICRKQKTLPRFFGQCDYNAKTISACSSLRGVDLMDTLIHELIHARWPDLAEEAVEEIATTLAGVLDAEGFRQADDHED
jgi:hypothetical protein